MTLIPYQGQLGHGRVWRDLFESAAAVSAVRANVKETDKAYIVEAELPGVKKEDITLICEKSVLTITAKADEAKDTEEGRYIRKERTEGEFIRRFALSDIDEENMSAKLENGILFVTLPKQKAQEKHIDID
jgi:HSP20 family protein